MIAARGYCYAVVVAVAAAAELDVACSAHAAVELAVVLRAVALQLEAELVAAPRERVCLALKVERILAVEHLMVLWMVMFVFLLLELV